MRTLNLDNRCFGVSLVCTPGTRCQSRCAMFSEPSAVMYCSEADENCNFEDDCGFVVVEPKSADAWQQQDFSSHLPSFFQVNTARCDTEQLAWQERSSSPGVWSFVSSVAGPSTLCQQTVLDLSQTLTPTTLDA
eukprot:GABV01012976.1.p1 GENE.GABV01012976.1~~GABV01012976.1.p1  ORF type:complete len:141 (-),score=36.39 GABV01012976.1:3-404(-)